MKKNIEILVACHKPTDVMYTNVFKPIQVGATGKNSILHDIYRDDQGENISDRNASYCELTAQYWAWKNLDLDYYGFCHYRRYFSFSNTHYREDPYGNVIELYLDEHAIDKYGLKDELIEKEVSKYDVIITERKDLHSLPGGVQNPRDHYRKAKHLHIHDFELMLSIIDEQYPAYSKAAHLFAEGNHACFCNMFIMRKELFFEYCEWMFAVLDEFCKRRNMKYYSTEAVRTPGHLSERLFNIFLLHLEEVNPGLRIKEVQCVLIQNTDPQERQLSPAFSERSIPVVFAANNNFVPMFAACFHSMLKHISPKNNYDVVLIESDLTQENKDGLQRIAGEKTNVSLRFYDPGRLLKDYNLKANAHITVETYFRFLIQDILTGYKKVLYLDCDTIINADVADLYETDVTGYMLAAVKDVDFLGQINGANAKTRQYCKEKFHMKNPYNYFQAGVIVFNEEEMKKAHSLKEWLEYASVPYLYNDQDVLNLYCEGHVKYLDMEWNMITDCDHYRVENVIKFAPDYVQKEYMCARQNPKIVHFAGHMKPWHRPTEDFAHLFWMELRETEYYEEMLFRMSEGIQYWERYEEQKEAFHIKMLDMIMPRGSARRNVVDSMYSKIIKQ